MGATPIPAASRPSATWSHIESALKLKRARLIFACIIPATHTSGSTPLYKSEQFAPTEPDVAVDDAHSNGITCAKLLPEATGGESSACNLP